MQIIDVSCTLRVAIDFLKNKIQGLFNDFRKTLGTWKGTKLCSLDLGATNEAGVFWNWDPGRYVERNL